MSKSILIEIGGLKETIFNWVLKGVGNVTKDPNALSPKFSLIYIYFFEFLILFIYFCIKQSMNNKMHQTRNEIKIREKWKQVRNKQSL